MKYILPIFLVLFSNAAFSLNYFGSDHSKWPQTEYRKVKDDFAGWLLVTSDTNWKQKWDAHPDTIPQFNEASEVKIGDKLVILSFFVNPKTDVANNVNVICSLKATRPDGSLSVKQENIVCAKGRLRGSSTNVRLSPAVINFVGKQTYPLGVWVIEVEIYDVVRVTRLNLKTMFELMPN